MKQLQFITIWDLQIIGSFTSDPLKLGGFALFSHYLWCVFFWMLDHKWTSKINNFFFNILLLAQTKINNNIIADFWPSLRLCLFIRWQIQTSIKLKWNSQLTFETWEICMKRDAKTNTKTFISNDTKLLDQQLMSLHKM